MPSWDVSTVGSTMLSLGTDPGMTLLGSDRLRVDIAGAESNVAIALARLGKRVSWQSRLCLSPLAERVLSSIRSHGVDVSHVARTVEGRQELFFLEAGGGSNRTTVTYDRGGAAIESLELADLDLAAIADSRFFHFTGITPALSDSCRDTLREVVERARAAGVTISCDLNYRSKLWSPEDARETMEVLLPEVDLLILGAGDLRLLWGRDGAPETELRHLQEAFGIGTVLLTRGAHGAAGIIDDRYCEQGAFAGEVVSPIGAGDAFAAGVLYSLVEGDPDLGLARGCAMAALAREARSDYVVGGVAALDATIGDGPDGAGIQISL